MLKKAAPRPIGTRRRDQKKCRDEARRECLRPLMKRRAGSLSVFFPVFCLLTVPASAQNTAWTAVLRGSWVRTGPAARGDVTLASAASTASIIVADDENRAVHQAAEFLAGDIENISGHRPAVGNTPASGRPNIRLATLGNAAVPATVNASALQGQWESYRIVTSDGDVWLIGADPRGTAFAAYTLSERLGIDPLYIWTGYRPAHHDPLVLRQTDFTQAPPAFRFRGFFHDDEDLLPRPFDANGYPLQTGDVPLEWYKRFFETALRLRMNMVAPYTRVHRRYEVQKLASDWGLYYTSHHYDILLSNPWGFERFNLAAERGVRPEYNWFNNREGMLTFWRGGVLENRALDAIWPVGMRGTADRPFVFPEGTTEAQRAATFREVIRDQVATVRELLPKDKTPLFTFTMYSEMLPEYQKNSAAFDLPKDVIIVWPDDNDGHMRALPASRGEWKHGVYYHLAYLGGNLSKQLTNTVVPQVITDQFEKIVKSGATDYMLVNVSELRDYVLGARLLADITWDAPAVFAAPDPAGRFTAWWSREYFPTSARAAGRAYEKYFAALHVPDQLWMASNAIQDLLGSLYRKVAGQTVEPLHSETVAQMRARLRQLDDALAAANRAESAMTASEQRFFSVNVALGLEVAQRQTEAALKLEDAFEAPDSARMWRLVREARASLELLETELARGEYPPFDRWYHESWIRSADSPNNPHRPYEQVRAFIASEGRGRVRRP